MYLYKQFSVEGKQKSAGKRVTGLQVRNTESFVFFALLNYQAEAAYLIYLFTFSCSSHPMIRNRL